MNSYNYIQTPEMMSALRGSSVSDMDAQVRAGQYQKIFSRAEEMNNLFSGTNLLQKNFSGYAETPILSTQYFNASVASFVSSFAGFMSVERDFEQPTGLFYWFDVLGVSDLKNRIPNLGPDQYQDVQTMGGFSTNIDVTANTAYTFLAGRKIIPGTLRIKVFSENEKYELIDNGQGEFMAVAGKIASSSINYLNGKIDFEFNAALNPAQHTLTVVGKEDVVGTPCGTNGADNSRVNDKRFQAKMQQIALTTVPDMLVAEYSIPAIGALQKATGSDMASFLFTKLREFYTKAINYKLISTLEEGYQGNTMNGLDLSKNALTGQFYDYRSRVDLFDAYLINVESALAAKAVKGVTTTAYVAGYAAANQFQKATLNGRWKRNDKSTYINDLIGWYNGIPVLRSNDIAEDSANSEGVFYAIHKTADGQMAPLARGIYMPLTDTPTVGNYNNPTQMSAGIYYQEGTRIMAPELIQRVSFKMGF
jgi:hypothetical protein